MPAFIREAVALVVLAFNFLVLELQTQVSRFLVALTFAAPQEVEAKAIDFASNCSSKDKARKMCVVVAEKPILVLNPF